MKNDQKVKGLKSRAQVSQKRLSLLFWGELMLARVCVRNDNLDIVSCAVQFAVTAVILPTICLLCDGRTFLFSSILLPGLLYHYILECLFSFIHQVDNITVLQTLACL